MKNQRFSVESGYVIDRLNPKNNLKARSTEPSTHYPPEDDKCLREHLLSALLNGLLKDLMVAPAQDITSAIRREISAISHALFSAIRISHLNTLDVRLSIHYRFQGELVRDRVGWRDFTSIALFLDDVERVLRDLYGESDNEAITDVRDALFGISKEFFWFLRPELSEEHAHAMDIDFACGIGVPEGEGISGSDCGRANYSALCLYLHSRKVRAVPKYFSSYTVKFVTERWPEPEPKEDVHNCLDDPF
jgi:hypothetical protein